MTTPSGILAGYYVTADTAAEMAPIVMAAVRAHPDRYSDAVVAVAADLDRIAARSQVDHLQRRLERIRRDGGVGRGVDGVSPAKLDTWHSVRDLVSALGIDRRTVAKRCRTGSIRAQKDEADQWRIPPEELERLRGGS